MSTLPHLYKLFISLEKMHVTINKEDMVLGNKEISLAEGAKILEIQKNSLQKLLQRKAVNGEKDEKGKWHIYLLDVLYYKENKGKSDEAPQGSLTVAESACCLGISRDEVINKIIDGSLRAIKTCHAWYIFRSSLIQALKKQIEILKSPDYIEECCEKIKILSLHGIYADEAVVIIQWLNKYPFHEMIIYKKDHHGHEIHEIRSCLDLVLLKISRNEIISLKIIGMLAHVMMKEFKQMNINLFRSHL